MPRELRISDRAARDLASIWRRHHTEAAWDQADGTLRRIVGAVRNLPFTPLASPLNAATGVRERIVEHHIVIYDVEPIAWVGPGAGHVNVLAILPCDQAAAPPR